MRFVRVISAFSNSTVVRPFFQEMEGGLGGAGVGFGCGEGDACGAGDGAGSGMASCATAPTARPTSHSTTSARPAVMDPTPPPWPKRPDSNGREHRGRLWT